MMMKALTVLSLLFLLWVPPAHAQTAITPDMVDTYQQSCLEIRDERMSEDTQALFCECTAYQMQKLLSVEDMETMAEQSQAGRDALNKMVLQVYAPCMEFPVNDLIFNRCMQNDFQSKKGICSCLADKMSAYTAESAQKTLGAVLEKNPNILDPMEPIVNSPEFERMEGRFALMCIQGQ